MSSSDVIRTVSNKLKYYFEVKRLEDGFDLSGVQSPRLDHPPLKPRATLQYDGLHDRPVKHYFSDSTVKARITHMNASPPTSPASPRRRVKSAVNTRVRIATNVSTASKRPQSAKPCDKPFRERQIKSSVKKYMSSKTWLEASPYIQPRGTLKNPWMPDFSTAHTPNATRGRPDLTGIGVPLKKSRKPYKGGYPLMKSVPPHKLSKGEAVRLVNMATKLLLATESIDFAALARSRSPKRGQKTANKALPAVPYDRPKTSRGKQRPSTAKYDYDINGRKQKQIYRSYDDSYVLDERQDSAYSTRNDSVSTYDSRNLPHWIRKEINSMDNEVDNERFVQVKSAPEPKSVARGRLKPPRRPKTAKYRKRPSKSDIPKGAIVSSDALSYEDDEDEDAEYGNTEDACVQTDKELLDQYDFMDEQVKCGKSTRYRVFVKTGKRLGASTKAAVFITLYGKNGKSEEILLEESRTHKVKFLKGQEDEFTISAFHVGELKKIRVGHNRVELGYGWYLDNVIIDDLEDMVSYRFPCGRWLSYQDEDGQTKRFLTVSTTRTIEHESEPESDTSETVASSRKSKSSKNSSSSHHTSTKSLASRELQDLNSTKSNGSLATNESQSEATETDSETGSTSEYSTESEGEEDEVVVNSSVPDEKPVIVKDREVSADEVRAVPPDRGSVQEDQSPRRNPLITNAKKENLDQSNTPGNPDYLQISGDSDNKDSVNPQLSSRQSDSSSQSYSGTSNTSSAAVVYPDKENPAFLKKKESKTRKSSNKTPEKKKQMIRTIHEAASLGDIDTVKLIVEDNQDFINNKDDHGLTAMHYSITDGHLELVKWLCDNGADLNAETPTGYSAAHLAALSGHVHCLMVLESHGATIDGKSIDGCTPLHFAARSGNLQTCKWLVSKGASLTDGDMMGRTAVDFANNYDQQEVEDFLEMALKAQDNKDDDWIKDNVEVPSKSSELPQRSEKSDQSEDDSYSSSESDDSTVMSDARSDKRRPSVSSTDEKKVEELKEKRQEYERHQKTMQNRHTSFLDSIRDEAIDS